jgi:hypothetical protein
MGQDTTDTTSTSPFASLFSSTDIATWGAGEYLAIGLGLIAAVSILRGVFSAGSAVKSTVRKRKRQSKKKQDLLDKLRDL